MPMKKTFKTFSILWINNFTIGLTYFSISSLSTLISADLGFSDAQLSILFSLPTFAFMIGMWFPGAIVDALGYRRSIPLVFCLTWLPSVFKLFTRNFTVFALLTVLQSCGILLASPTTSKTVKDLQFPQPGKILGVVNTGMTIGTWCSHTFSLRLAESLSGWKGASFLYLAITFLLGGLGLLLMFSEKAAVSNEQKTAQPYIVSVSKEKAARVFSLFAGSRRYKVILLSLAAIYFSNLAVSFSLNNWLPKLLTYGGFPAQVSASAASFFALGSMCSAILVPFLLPQLLERSQYIAPISILGSILLSSLAFIQLAWAAVTISLALGILIGIIQLVVICKIVENSHQEALVCILFCVFCRQYRGNNRH